jgi:hypothetical protein
LATTAGTPVNTSAGNVRRDPPPAIAFIAPAPKAALIRRKKEKEEFVMGQLSSLSFVICGF